MASVSNSDVFRRLSYGSSNSSATPDSSRVNESAISGRSDRSALSRSAAPIEEALSALQLHPKAPAATLVRFVGPKSGVGIHEDRFIRTINNSDLEINPNEADPYERKIAEACTGKSSAKIFTYGSNLTKHLAERGPSIPKSEEYTEKHLQMLDLPTFPFEYFSKPAAISPRIFSEFSNQKVKLGFICEDIDHEGPDGTIQRGGQIYIWNPESKKTEILLEGGVYPSGKKPTSLEFIRNGKGILVGRYDGGVETWSIEEGNKKIVARSFPARESSEELAPIYTLAVAKGRIFAGDTSGKIFVINPGRKNRTERLLEDFGGRVGNIVVSPNEKYIAIGTDNGQVHVLDSETLESVYKFEAPVATGMRAMAFAPGDLPWIAIGGGKTYPHVWLHRFESSNAAAPIDIGDMGSQITNLMWPVKNRLVLSYYKSEEELGYKIIPIRQNEPTSFEAGSSLDKRISEKVGQILFAGIADVGQTRNLFLAGTGEVLTVYPMPGKKMAEPKDNSDYLSIR